MSKNITKIKKVLEQIIFNVKRERNLLKNKKQEIKNTEEKSIIDLMLPTVKNKGRKIAVLGLQRGLNILQLKIDFFKKI